MAAAQAQSAAASAALRAVLEADVLAGGDPFGDEKEEEFDDEITVIPTMAAAACAAAFAEVAAEAEADQEMDMLIALSGGGQDGPTREPRPAGFYEALGLDIGREFGEAFDDDIKSLDVRSSHSSCVNSASKLARVLKMLALTV